MVKFNKYMVRLRQPSSKISVTFWKTEEIPVSFYCVAVKLHVHQCISSELHCSIFTFPWFCNTFLNCEDTVDIELVPDTLRLSSRVPSRKCQGSSQNDTFFVKYVSPPLSRILSSVYLPMLCCYTKHTSHTVFQPDFCESMQDACFCLKTLWKWHHLVLSSIPLSLNLSALSDPGATWWILTQEYLKMRHSHKQLCCPSKEWSPALSQPSLVRIVREKKSFLNKHESQCTFLCVWMTHKTNIVPSSLLEHTSEVRQEPPPHPPTSRGPWGPSWWAPGQPGHSWVTLPPH